MTQANKAASRTAATTKRKPIVRSSPKPPALNQSLPKFGEPIIRHVAHEDFQKMEAVLAEAGIIDDIEWFAKGGVVFLVKGQPTRINPTHFDGGTWIVEISRGSLPLLELQGGAKA